MASPSAERVYREATRLFGERSYPATSMRDISEAVGILPGSLYSHINSKEALLFTIIEDGINKYLDALRPIAEAAEPPEVRMRAAVKAFVGVAAENVEQTSVALHQWRYLTESHHKRVVRKRKEYEEIFAQIVDEGVRSGVFSAGANRRIPILALMGMLNWVPEWYSPTGEGGVDEVGDTLADFILTGLC